MKKIVALSLSAFVLGCASAGAQQTAAPPCSTAEFRQMDFWVGDWEARYTQDANAPADGRNVVTREYAGCVIQEAFDGGPNAQGLIGHSVSTYSATDRKWRQTWVDNQGGYFALSGGAEGDRFVLVGSRLSDNVPIQRMLFEDITPAAFTWKWQASTDGGVTWTDRWVIYYTRRAVN